jgi:hypothetical protein
MRFEYYCRLSPDSCSWLSVDAQWPGKEKEGLARLFGAEIHTNSGWITLRQPPENRRYWQTREELWIELCFEAFLEWCNRELTPNSWLVLYDTGFGAGDAKIHKDHALATASISSWEKGIIEDLKLDSSETEKLKAEACYFIAPLFKNSSPQLSENVTPPM